MCSIVGSFSKPKLIELCKLNEYRGQHSHSISYLDPNGLLYVDIKQIGPINYDDINIGQDEYCIVHMQAPTTEADDANIHPARFTSDTLSPNNGILQRFLWHNGIIKAHEVLRLQQLLNMHNVSWDTKLLLNYIEVGYSLSDVDGSFSCVHYTGDGIELFRNEISPMFIDADFNMSSTKFKGSSPTVPNCILSFDPFNKEMSVIDTFVTKVNPYYFEE